MRRSERAGYCVGSTVRSLAIQPSVLPDSRNTDLPGAPSQTEISGQRRRFGSDVTSERDWVLAAFELV
jgi:hypothetical protein